MIATRRIPCAAKNSMNIVNVAAARGSVVVRANGNVDVAQELGHAFFPASAVEYDRNSAPVRQPRGSDAERHVMAVHLQNLDSTQPSWVEFCTHRRKDSGIGRDHRTLARAVQNHDGRDWRWFLASACEVVQRNVAFLQVGSDYRPQRVRAHRSDQCRTPAEKGKRHSSICGRPSG